MNYTHSIKYGKTPEERKFLYSVALNGQVIAENLTISWAAFIAAALTDREEYPGSIKDITIQRVSENDE